MQGGANGSNVDVIRFDGETWQAVGDSANAGIGYGGVHGGIMTLKTDTTPIVGFASHHFDGTLRSYIRIYDGSTWRGVGGPGDSGRVGAALQHTGIIDVITDSQDRPVIARFERSGGDCQLYLERFENSTWVSLDPPSGGCLGQLGAGRDSEIWAVLAFIKNSWPINIQERQSEFSRTMLK